MQQIYPTSYKTSVQQNRLDMFSCITTRQFYVQAQTSSGVCFRNHARLDNFFIFYLLFSNAKKVVSIGETTLELQNNADL